MARNQWLVCVGITGWFPSEPAARRLDRLLLICVAGAGGLIAMLFTLRGKSG